ncbi:MAG: hypothetical protein JXB88_03665, partial [Spirochaetales bacterium]|nr:hypothetical protein [Spirochaetales bacterium]
MKTQWMNLFKSPLRKMKRTPNPRTAGIQNMRKCTALATPTTQIKRSRKRSMTCNYIRSRKD